MKALVYDVIVIGGGPAGMMTAYQAAKRGKKVLLLEKNDSLGKKLLITGGGRCNITNATYNLRDLLPRYGEAEQFLYSPFSQFSVKDTFDFFTSHKLNLKVEVENRVFPVTDMARSVWQVLVDGLKKYNVEVLSHACVSEVGVVVDKQGVSTVSEVTLKNNQKYQASSVVVATGGMSHPETGSTGDGFIWLQKIGHKIIKPAVSLVPLKAKDTWPHVLQGITLPEVKLYIAYDSGDGVWHKDKVVKGKILFTHFGVSGPTVLNLSKKVSDYLEYADVKLIIDICPDMDHGILNQSLQDVFLQNAKKKIKNTIGQVVGERVPQSFLVTILGRAGIDLDTYCHSVTREMRMCIIDALKKIEVPIEGLLGEDKAIVSSGGVALEEIDWKTMQSKVVRGLFVVGDMLNINRPSGGYSLQICWTTGYVAGQSV